MRNTNIGQMHFTGRMEMGDKKSWRAAFTVVGRKIWRKTQKSIMIYVMSWDVKI